MAAYAFQPYTAPNRSHFSKITNRKNNIFREVKALWLDWAGQPLSCTVLLL